MAMTAVVADDDAEIADRIVGFLKDQAIPLPEGVAPLDVPLLEGDLLDSLGVVQLTVFLGEELDIEIEDDDFEAENFATVGRLVDLIKSKRGA